MLMRVSFWVYLSRIVFGWAMAHIRFAPTPMLFALHPVQWAQQPLSRHHHVQQ
jgi:hypothetical protein